MKSLFYVFGLSLCFQFANKALAQLATGAVKGRVLDSLTGKGLSKSNVYLFRKSVLLRTATSDDRGSFLFSKLDPDTYRLEVRKQNFNRLVKPELIIRKGVITNFTASLKRKRVMADPQELVYEARPMQQEVKHVEISLSKSSVAHSTPMKGNRVVSGSVKDEESHVSPRIRNNALRFDEEGKPNPTNPGEEYALIKENSFQAAVLKPLSTFSIDVDKSAYSNIRRMLNAGQMPPPDAVRLEEMVNYFDYPYAGPENQDPFAIHTEYTRCPWNSKHHILQIGIQGRKISLENMPANNLVFLLDVSGSMNEANKLPLVKASLRLLVNQMRAEDKVSIVVYAGAAGVVLPPTFGTDKPRILDALDRLSAGGSTAGGEGILLAYKIAGENFLTNGNNRIILATDGDFNVGIQNQNDLEHLIVQKRKENVFLSVLGFGTGNYKDARMETLADKGNGNYAYIDDLLEANKVLVKEMGGTILTIAKDVKIQVEFNPARVKSYRLIGYENRLLEDRDFNDDRKDAGELGSGHTVTALYEIVPTSSEEKPDSVDALRYQDIRPNPGLKDELMTLKLRYKDPTDTSSKLITHIVRKQPVPLEKATDHCRFACSVVEFGMLLRNSAYKANTSFASVLELARGAKGTDDEGYRGEFIRLVSMAEKLKP